MRKYLNIITENAASNTLKIINDFQDLFDYFIVVDSEYNKDNYKSCVGKKSIIIDYKWRNDFQSAYDKQFSILANGDWAFVIDDDEYLSIKLINEFENIIKDSQFGRTYDSVIFPVIEYFNGNPIQDENNLPSFYNPNIESRCFLIRKKYNPIKTINFGYRVIPKGDKYIYYSYPIYHYKTTEDYIDYEFYHWVIYPNVSFLDPEIKRFKQLLSEQFIVTISDLRNRIITGRLNKDLENLIYEYRDRRKDDGALHPLAQLYTSYYLLHCGKEAPDNKYTLESIKKEIENWKMGDL